ncbi:MAG: hypothetical protein V1885_01560 [Candidatus Brennerbacteria bacterium]
MHLLIYKSFLLSREEFVYHIMYLSSERRDDVRESIPELEARLKEILDGGEAQENGLSLSFSISTVMPEIAWRFPLDKNNPLRVANLDGEEQDMVWDFVRMLAQKGVSYAAHVA